VLSALQTVMLAAIPASITNAYERWQLPEDLAHATETVVHWTTPLSRRSSAACGVRKPDSHRNRALVGLGDRYRARGYTHVDKERDSGRPGAR
jgi:hypothetical protein